MRFLLAVAVAVLVVLSAPFIRDIRDFVRATFPGQFAMVVAAAVALAIAAALVMALVRIRDRRLPRYGAIAAALMLGVAYSMWNRQGTFEVDAVEQFHFVEYGLITLLFYRAWRPVGDISVLLLPIFAGLVAATMEEWLQWFIPGRVGDMRDVFLNAAAILCGLLFSLGLDPPERLSWQLNPGSLRRIGVAASVAIAIFAAFLHVVHLGVEIDDDQAGRFRSRYDAATLKQLSADRAARWKSHPPLQRPLSRSREDQYQSEGHLHVMKRNTEWAAGSLAAAWHENLILERYYEPVLSAPSYLSPVGHRWPDEQRADAQNRAGASAGGAGFVSEADVAEGRHFIRLWPKPLFWGIVGLAVVTILGVCFRLDRRR